MKERLEQRLAALRSEYEAGQKLLAELDARRASTQETMLRIAGAIQVLEEELQHETTAEEPNNNLAQATA